MVDAMRKPVHSKVPVSLGMYSSLYKRDYRWHEEIKPPSEEGVQKLRAKEFAMPQEPQAMTYSNSTVREGREVTAEPGAAQKQKQEDIACSPRALQQAQEEQRKHLNSTFPLAEGYVPKHYPATELTANQAERLERAGALSELENELSPSQRLWAAAGSPGAAGILLRRQNLNPCWGTYQHFMLETGRARQHEAQQNRNMALGSSISLEDCFDLDRRSTYSTDFQHWPAAHGGCCKANGNLSHVFPEEGHFHKNHWVSEYEDNYSIYFQKLNQASQDPTVRLSPALKFQGLSSQSGIGPGTAQ